MMAILDFGQHGQPGLRVLLRYAPGEVPVYFLNIREKWLCEEKPRYRLIDTSELSVPSRSRQAFEAFSRSNKICKTLSGLFLEASGKPGPAHAKVLRDLLRGDRHDIP